MRHEEPLLRVGDQRLTHGHIEKIVVERFGAFQEAAAGDVRGIIEIFGAFSGRQQLFAAKGRYAFLFLDEQLPQQIDVIGARESPRHADNGDLFDFFTHSEFMLPFITLSCSIRCVRFLSEACEKMLLCPPFINAAALAANNIPGKFQSNGLYILYITIIWEPTQKIEGS
jgi:hypothetical protein